MAVTGTRGRHIIAEYWECSPEVLGDLELLRNRLMFAAKAAGATIVETVFHRFTPTGVSGVVVVEESHLSIHTWPEEAYVAADFYTCGNCIPERAIEILKDALSSKRTHTLALNRGISDHIPSFQILP